MNCLSPKYLNNLQFFMISKIFNEKGDQNMGKCLIGRSLLLFYVIAVSLVLGSVMPKAFADKTAVDPDLIFSPSVTIPNDGDKNNVTSLGSSIVLSWDDTNDLKVGSQIVLTAPSGTKWSIAGTSAGVNSGVNLKMTVGNSTTTGTVGITGISGSTQYNIGSPDTIGNLTAPQYLSLAGTNTDSAAVDSLNGYAQQVASSSDFLAESDTQFGFTIKSWPVGSTSASFKFEIGTGTALSLYPSSTSRNNDVNTPNISISAQVNKGSNASKTAAVGDIDLLARPKIIGAVQDSSTDVIVEFNVGVNSTQGANASYYSVLVDGTATAAGAGVVNPTTAAIVDGSSNKKVKLTSSTSFNFDGLPVVRFPGTNLISNTDGATVKNYSTKAFPISKSGASITSITVPTDSRVSSKKEASLAAKSESKLKASFVLSTKNPFKFYFARANDTQSPPSPLSTGHLISRNTGTRTATSGISAKIGSNHAPREDFDETGTATARNLVPAGEATMVSWGDQYNVDVFVVPGSDSGTAVDVDFVFGGVSSTSSENVDAFSNAGSLEGLAYVGTDTTSYLPKGFATATAIAVGENVEVVIVGSVDDFNTTVKSNSFTVDNSGPAVKSGTSAPTAPTRSSVVVNFDSALAASTVQDLSNWRFADQGTSVTAYPPLDANTNVTKVVLSSDQKTVTLTSKTALSKDTSVNIGVRKFGTPTASAITDTYWNPIGGGTITSRNGITSENTLEASLSQFTIGKFNSGFSTIGTATIPGGDAASIAIVPNAQGNNAVSDASKVLDITLLADPGLTTSNIWIGAFGDSTTVDSAQSATTKGSALTTVLTESVVDSNTSKYSGKLTLNTTITSTEVFARAKVSTTEPTTLADWGDVISGAIEVDNTKPTVTAAGVFTAPDKVTIKFSEGMNVTNMANADYFPRVKEKEGTTLSVTNVSIGSASEATYTLFGDVLDLVTYEVDFNVQTNGTAMLTDDAGNELQNLSLVGTDMAEFTTTSVFVTPTPVVSPTPDVVTSPTPVVSPTPGTTPVVTPTPGTTPVVTPTPGTTPVVTPTPVVKAEVSKLEVDPKSMRRSPSAAVVTVTALDKDGKPVAGATVEAKGSKGGKVDPASKVTDTKGIAEFNVQFGFTSKKGKVEFTSGKVKATVKQKPPIELKKPAPPELTPEQQKEQDKIDKQKEKEQKQKDKEKAKKDKEKNKGKSQ